MDTKKLLNQLSDEILEADIALNKCKTLTVNVMEGYFSEQINDKTAMKLVSEYDHYSTIMDIIIDYLCEATKKIETLSNLVDNESKKIKNNNIKEDKKGYLPDVYDRDYFDRYAPDPVPEDRRF